MKNLYLKGEKNMDTNVGWRNTYRAFSRNLGWKLRMMRDYLSLNQAEAAVKFGVSEPLITQYEGGNTNVNLLYIQAIIRACGVSFDDLFLDNKEFVHKLYY